MILSKGFPNCCGLKFRRCASVLVMLLFLVCITAPAAGTPRYVLSSIIGEGAAGSLANGTASFPEGTEVPYAFTPAPGYSSVIVVIDGTVASSSGTITMNANRRPSHGVAPWILTFGEKRLGIFSYPKEFGDPVRSRE